MFKKIIIYYKDWLFSLKYKDVINMLDSIYKNVYNINQF